MDQCSYMSYIAKITEGWVVYTIIIETDFLQILAHYFCLNQTSKFLALDT